MIGYFLFIFVLTFVRFRGKNLEFSFAKVLSYRMNVDVTWIHTLPWTFVPDCTCVIGTHHTVSLVTCVKCHSAIDFARSRFPLPLHRLHWVDSSSPDAPWYNSLWYIIIEDSVINVHPTDWDNWMMYAFFLEMKDFSAKWMILIPLYQRTQKEEKKYMDRLYLT